MISVVLMVINRSVLGSGAPSARRRAARSMLKSNSKSTKRREMRSEKDLRETCLIFGLGGVTVSRHEVGPLGLDPPVSSERLMITKAVRACGLTSALTTNHAFPAP
jgi:hypothetical protein